MARSAETLEPDLFGHTASFQRIPLEGADILYLERTNLENTLEDLLSELISQTAWQARSVQVWGKRHVQPRLVAWFGDAGKSYSYSGTTLIPEPWTELLRKIRGRVEQYVAAEFNSVLLNYYRSERDSMGFHSDNERELGQRPVIASLSVGETRRLVFKHINKRFRDVTLDLPSGSLLVMQGETQANWKHGIPKESTKRGPRVNLTFRQIGTQHFV